MICSTTYRTVLAFGGAMIMTLGTFSILQASAPWDSPRTEYVHYHDADLKQPANTVRLYKRIEAAAGRVCAPLDSGGLATKQSLDSCVERAIGTAVAEVNHPQLSALHSATMGRWQAANERPVKSGI